MYELINIFIFTYVSAYIYALYLHTHITFLLQGVRTLWGSFEIKNSRLGSKMLQQHARVSMTNCGDDLFNDAADSFTKLPLWCVSLANFLCVCVALQTCGVDLFDDAIIFFY